MPLGHGGGQGGTHYRRSGYGARVVGRVRLRDTCRVERRAHAWHVLGDEHLGATRVVPPPLRGDLPAGCRDLGRCWIRPRSELFPEPVAREYHSVEAWQAEQVA